VVLFAAAIFYLSSQSLDFVGAGPFPQWDKFAHATEYGLFCFLVLRAMRGTFPEARTSSIALWALLIVVSYGASDEFHQSFSPHRDADILDLLADGGGATLVSAIWLLRS